MKLRYKSAAAPSLPPSARRLLDHLAYEIVPMRSIDGAIEALPTESTVSVTCSPTLGIAATQQHSDALLALGHTPIPHLAARLVAGPAHARSLAEWSRARGLKSVFVIAGDAQEASHYSGAVDFLRDFIASDPGVERIGIAAYPDGHPLIATETLRAALHAKQALLDDAGIDGWASTQMCFNPELISSWLSAERSRGLTLPIHLGIPGVIDRARLMKMGVRLGIGASLRYLSKNRSTMSSLLSAGGYDPSELVGELAPVAAGLGIEALHCFTFNSVAETADWLRAASTGLGDDVAVDL